MIKTLILFIFCSSFYCVFSQEQLVDKIELKNGEIFLGKVVIVKKDIVEFKENETSVNYEFKKNEIRYIALSNGRILTFEKESATQTTYYKKDSYESKDNAKSFLYLGGGISSPLSPDNFSDYWNMGYNIGADLNIGLTSIVRLGFAIAYNSFGFNDEKVLKDAGLSGYNIVVTGGETGVLLLMVDLNIAFTKEALQPYVSLGVGYHSTEINDATVSEAGVSQTAKGSSDDGFSYIFGLGLDIPLSYTLYMFLEGKFLSANVEGENLNSLFLKTGIAFVL